MKENLQLAARILLIGGAFICAIGAAIRENWEAAALGLLACYCAVKWMLAEERNNDLRWKRLNGRDIYDV